MCVCVCVCVCVCLIWFLFSSISTLMIACVNDSWSYSVTHPPTHMCQEDCQQLVVKAQTWPSWWRLYLPAHSLTIPGLPLPSHRCYPSTQPTGMFSFSTRPSRTIAAATELCRKATLQETGWRASVPHTELPSALVKISASQQWVKSKLKGPLWLYQ